MAGYDYDIAVIGAGAGGLVVAIGAAAAGKKVAIIDHGPYGGDCTNFGCIPSKTLIDSAHSAHLIREAAQRGIQLPEPLALETSGVFTHIKNNIQEVRSHGDAEALQAKGITTFTGKASLQNTHSILITYNDGSEEVISGNDIVIATGSLPTIPPIPGLKDIPYLTNQTIFNLDHVPSRLAIIGGGAIGCEIAQAFQRLGSQVSIIQHSPTILNKEEPEAQEMITSSFCQEGISLFLNHNIVSVENNNSETLLTIEDKNSKINQIVACDELLIATGHSPNIYDLDLEFAEIDYSSRGGVEVDQYGRSSQKNIWAVGDAIGPPYFSHWAESQARSVLTSLLLPWYFKKKVAFHQLLPRTTFTAPEVAAVGLSEEEARQRYGTKKIAVYLFDFKDLDRAITAGHQKGLVKVITKKWSSRILGATIVGERAGEMIMEIVTAMHAKMSLRKLAKIIHPYPTYTLAIRKTADLWLKETILPILKPRS
ncbi:MAG: dihydrolipoyl dehydrogenase family protein [Chlamydiota bacterium]